MHQSVIENRPLTVKDIAKAYGISSEQVHKVLHQNLDMRKLSARWVPRLLTIDHKREGKGRSLCRKSDGDSFLGQPWNNFDRLPCNR